MSQKTCLRETLYSLVGWGIGEDEIAGAILRVPRWPWGFFICARFESFPLVGWQPHVSEFSRMYCWLAFPSRWGISRKINQ